MNKYDVIVIGGGASGLMAAGRAAEKGKKVLLFEKNKNLGEKLKITGGGRCNITNAEEDHHILLSKYGDAKHYLYSPFSKFGMSDTFSFFKKRGLPIIIQDRKRAFPETENAHDVYKVLENYIKKGGVEIHSSSNVDSVIGRDGIIEKVIVSGVEYVASSYILATGGISHPETGSTGDGFKWLKELGHKIEEPTPTIVPLAVSDSWVKKLSGVSLPHMKITFFVNGIKKISQKGELLFTHFGLSGPLILNISKKVADFLHEGQVTALIDTYPDLDIGSLDKMITQIFDSNKNKMIKNVFKDIAPNGTSDVVLSLDKQIDPNIKIHSMTKEARRQLTDLLKALPVSITGLMGYDRAVIADGGVSLKEIDTRTMRSNLYKNLYITGDLLHVSRPSGGFSLQLCWTTGYVAGNNA